MFLRGISMKKLIEILRLHYDGKLSQRQISEALNVARSTVGDYIRKFAKSGLSWPLDTTYQNEELLSQALKPSYQAQSLVTKRSMIDFTLISKELRKHKNLTLQLLWEEGIESGTMPYSYSNFSLLYRKWLGKQPKYMRQVHKSGEKVFVDYSGDKVKIIDTDTGLLRDAEIFVGVLGASNYIYLEATWSQNLSDWTMSHVRMFEHFQGSPRLVIPDNLRSGVSRSHRYDPDITPAYFHMLAHYGAACMPARIYTPKDKANAENGVLIIQRWILSRLRHEQIYGLAALNARLSILMEQANSKQFKLYPDCRYELFNELDKPYLRPLPNYRYVYREYKKVWVSGDYHIELNRHYYSVPYKLIGQEIDVWYTAGLVECFHNNICVAKHIRSNEQRSKTTVMEHMPRAHREYASLTVDKMQEWSQTIGTSTGLIVESIIKASPHPEIGCKRSHGFLNLIKKYSELQLESACSYALKNGIKNYEYIEIIIKQQISEQQHKPVSAIPEHENIRGSEQYH
jgi:transposase